MFKRSLLTANTVEFTVKGTVPGDAGKPEPFSFTLTATRAKQSEIEDMLEQLRSGAGVVQAWMAERVHGWKDVTEPDGSPVPYSAQAFGELLDVPGLSGVVFSAYVEACSAKGKAKN